MKRKASTPIVLTIEGPLGRASREYVDWDALMSDKDAWSTEYGSQWRVMPWWRRVLSRIKHVLGLSTRIGGAS